ncbi:hypothetical protein FRC10_004271 [Ceratobasidium sp. 414]|nr:hypothetical protein FRC10_004271 [Ceratobasidium sp. 414]
MTVQLNPQEQANIKHLLHQYRHGESQIDTSVVEKDLKHFFGSQKDVYDVVQQWMNCAIQAYDVGLSDPELPVDESARVPDDQLPAPEVGKALASAMKILDLGKKEAEQRGHIDVDAGPSKILATTTGTESPTVAGIQPSTTADKRPPTTGGKRPPTTASKQPRTTASKQPRTTASKQPRTTAGKQPPAARKTLPTRGGKKLPASTVTRRDQVSPEPMDISSSDAESWHSSDAPSFDGERQNDAMALRHPDSGVRMGTDRRYPVQDSEEFTFCAEKGLKRNGDELWIRSSTNFSFMNEGGEPVSIAEGPCAQQTYLLGVSASINTEYESGCRIASGLWADDKLSRKRTPVEMLWVKARVEHIKSATVPWFRNNGCKVLMVQSPTSAYVLQSPTPNYASRFQKCVVGGKKFQDSDYHLAKGAEWMPREFWSWIQEDVVRFTAAGKMSAPPNPPRQPSAVKDWLQVEGKLTNLQNQIFSLEGQLSRLRRKRSRRDAGDNQQAKLEKLKKDRDQCLATIKRTKHVSSQQIMVESDESEPEDGSESTDQRSESDDGNNESDGENSDSDDTSDYDFASQRRSASVDAGPRLASLSTFSENEPGEVPIAVDGSTTRGATKRRKSAVLPPSRGNPDSDSDAIGEIDPSATSTLAGNPIPGLANLEVNPAPASPPIPNAGIETHEPMRIVGPFFGARNNENGTAAPTDLAEQVIWDDRVIEL